MSDFIERSTSYGTVRGLSGNGVSTFLGIPFAHAYRFEPPAAPPQWSSTRDCTMHAPVCPQVSQPPPFDRLMRDHPASEDCLSINIWAPSGAQDLPVLVWLHGGGFLCGSGSDPMYDGRQLAADGVVVVTVNYRLGPFGFLHVNADTGWAGNRGLEDQIAALEWVQDNIGEFGGDRKRVTAGGVSAGAMSVAALMATPAAGSLFHRAILQSGAGHHALPAEVAVRVADAILRQVADDTGGDARSAAADALVAATQRTFDDRARLPELLGESADVGLPVAPVIDGVLLNQRPIDAIAGQPPRGLDVLLGTNADEFRLFPAIVSDMADLPEDAVFGMLAAHLGAEGARDAIATYAARRPGASPTDLLAAAETDRIYRVPAIRLADALVGNRVYVYRFGWPTPAFGGSVGACHAVEVPFVFGTQNDDACVGLMGPNAPAELSQHVRSAWCRFIHDGEPRHVGGCSWPSWNPEQRPTMEIDLVPRVADDPLGDEVAIWHHI